MPRISLLTFHHLVRTVLLMYVLTLGVAMASPLMKPDAMNLICTSTGYKLVGNTSDAGQGKSSAQTHLLDCPLCVATTLLLLLRQIVFANLRMLCRMPRSRFRLHGLRLPSQRLSPHGVRR
jgi:hypothetical protein